GKRLIARGPDKTPAAEEGRFFPGGLGGAGVLPYFQASAGARARAARRLAALLLYSPHRLTLCQGAAMAYRVYAMDTCFFTPHGNYDFDVRCEMLRELGYEGTYLTLWSEQAWADLERVP